MEFAECRQKVFQDLVSVVDEHVDPSQVFLLLGGIRAGIYQYTAKGLPFFIPSGIEMIHYPAILERHGIAYRKVSIDSVLANCKKDSDYMQKKMFIMLFLDSILESAGQNYMQDNMFGDSQLTIKSIDLKQNRIILNHENTKHYWVDIDVFREVEKRAQISMANQLCIYEIDREQMRQNQSLVEYIRTPREELLRSCCWLFMKNRRLQVMDNFIRFDGKIAYQFMEQTLLSLREEYSKCRDYDRREKMQRYVRGVLLQYKRFASVSSDGNYRNEFATILFEMGKPYAEAAKGWKKISTDWIQLTLETTKLLACKKDVTEELLDCLTVFHRETSKCEFEQMEALIEVM